MCRYYECFNENYSIKKIKIVRMFVKQHVTNDFINIERVSKVKGYVPFHISVNNVSILVHN